MADGSSPASVGEYAIKKKSPVLPRWAHWAAGSGLAAFTLLWMARWPAFPLVLDPYYHLLVASQIADAGGPFLHEWWQYAPVGRPHLYPPILHLILAGGLGAGIAPLTVIRIASVVAVPALIFSLFLVARRMMPSEEALCVLWMSLIPFGFHLHSAVTLAATLGVIQLLWFIVALERGKAIAVGALFGLLTYTHLGLPWIALISAVVYVLLRPQTRATLWRGSWGLLLALPWWIHLARHRGSLHPVPRVENALAEIWPGLLLMAVIGAWVCLRAPRRWAFPLACSAGFLLLAPSHSYRLVNGEGVIALILLAGVGLSALAKRLFPAAEHSRQVLAMLVLAILVACLPTVTRQAGVWRADFGDSSPWHLVGLSRTEPKDLEASLAVPRIAQLAETVRLQSQPGQILWSNAPYVLGLLAVLAHRPMASAMFHEVGPARAFDPIEASQVFVWFKMAPLLSGPLSPTMLPETIERVFEDDLAVVFVRRNDLRQARAPKAFFKWGWAAAGIFVLMGLTIGDFRRKGHSPDRSV